MKTNLTWIGLCIAAAYAQQTQPPPGASTTPPDPAAAKATAESPVPGAADRWLTGSIDLGYRWRTGPGGNENVYRSVVDLGAGPKLLDADLSILDPKRRWFDRITIRAAD